MSLEIKTKVTMIERQTKYIEVTDDESYQDAGKFRTQVRALKKSIDASWDPVIEKAHEAHKEALKQKKVWSAPLELAETMVKGHMDAYLKKRKQEALIQEQRIAQESARLLAASFVSTILPNTTIQASEYQLATVIPIVAIAPASPKVDGISVRSDWTFRITDESLIPREFLIPDMKKIREEVKKAKSLTNIGGVEAYEVDGSIASAR